MMKSVFAGVASLTALALGSAAVADPLAMEDLLDLESVGAIAVSPDGDAIAYTLSSMPNVADGEKNGTATSAVRIATGPDKNSVYVPAHYRPSGIQWLDTKTLAFLGRGPNDKTNAVYTISVAGGAPKKMFGYTQAISAYRISGDGETLYFSSTDQMDGVTRKARGLGFDVNVMDETARFRRLYRVDLTDSEASASKMDVPGHVSTFEVSPDGRRLLVALADTPLVGDDIINKKFHIVNARTGRVQSVIDTAGKIGGASFSPDGSKIAFFAGIDRSDPIARTVGIADARTGDFEFLTGEDDADEMDLFWTGSDTMTVLYHEGVTTGTYTLTTSGDISDRSVSDVALASIDGRAGSIAAVGHTSEYPRALFSGPSGTGKTLTKWTNHNAWLNDKSLPAQQVVEWTARDGVRVEGLLILPEGRKPRTGWPMVTIVHGGPEAHYSDGWVTRYSEPGHVLAGEGIAAFYPNYRGSTGRGQGFAKLDHADPPAAEFNDLVDGIEALADRGLIDPDRVGITGGSYGGFASAWGATALTDHFAAAVIFVALTDLTSFMGTTDIPTEMVDSHFMVPPEGNWDLYREWSPIYHAAKSKTPALIAHGEVDPRVHPSQSLELYRYLKRVGQAPVRLVTYPGEPHGNRKAAGQYDYGLRLMRWMQFYLVDGGDGMPPVDLPEVRALAE